MRFYLTAHGVEAEISVSAADRGPMPTVTTIRHSAPGSDEPETRVRRFTLGVDAAHELLEDGSYRRHSLLQGQHYGQNEISFFHSGRVRTVHPVGGVGGRVESPQSEGNVSAPMNGQVVKIAKQVGDPIANGEIVLILEAMKMENEVTAPMSGVLKELRVEPGQAVSPGQLLFCVEAAE